MARKLRVAIDCRIADPRQGIGTAFLAFAKALSESCPDGHEYTFIVHERLQSWLEPVVCAPCTIHGIASPPPNRLSAKFRRIAPLRWIWREFLRSGFRVPVSDGIIEAGGYDVVHFPTQVGYLTSVPSIYQPWDLQHLHFPGFFSREDYLQREAIYRALCGQATFVCVQTEWTRRDILSKYELPAQKVVTVPWGSVFEAYEKISEEDINATRARYKLSDCFLFYPAATWAHKNHKCILEALSTLKCEQASTPHAYFTGAVTSLKAEIDELARKLGIGDQIHFLGFVEPRELQAIYRLATALVFPSRFEGFGLPILEAFHAGLPVICSNATTLPEVAGGGALYFDPDAPRQLAEQVIKLLHNPSVRLELVKEGALVLESFPMKRTANGLRRLYDRAASARNADHMTQTQIG